MAGSTRMRFAAAGVAMALLSGCWLQVGYGPEHRRFNDSETGLTRDNVATLSEAWSVAGPGTLTEPIVDGNRVFTTRSTSSPNASVAVWAIDATTGATAWDTPLFSGGDGVSTVGTPAALSHGKLWAGWGAATNQPLPPNFGAAVVRLDPTNGSLDASELGTFAPSPVVTPGGDVIVQLTEALSGTTVGPLILTVRDAATLATRWTAEISSFTPQLMMPTVDADRIYVVKDMNLSIYTLLGCGGGSPCPPTASVDLDGWASGATPVAGPGDEVFLTTSAGYAIAFDGATATEKWRASVGSSFGRMALANGVLYVSGGGTLQAYDASGCAESPCTPLWTASTGAAVKSAPVVAGGVVYVGVSGAVEAYDADGCGGAANCPALVSVPVIGPVSDLSVAQGKVFAVSPGRLTALAPV